MFYLDQLEEDLPVSPVKVSQMFNSIDARGIQLPPLCLHVLSVTQYFLVDQPQNAHK